MKSVGEEGYCNGLCYLLFVNGDKNKQRVAVCGSNPSVGLLAEVIEGILDEDVRNHWAKFRTECPSSDRGHAPRRLGSSSAYDELFQQYRAKLLRPLRVKVVERGRAVHVVVDDNEPPTDGWDMLLRYRLGDYHIG